MPNGLSEIVQMIQDCEARESQLSDWERGFIDSLGTQLAKGGRPSQAQQDKLDAIWERVTTKPQR